MEAKIHESESSGKLYASVSDACSGPAIPKQRESLFATPLSAYRALWNQVHCWRYKVKPTEQAVHSSQPRRLQPTGFATLSAPGHAVVAPLCSNKRGPVSPRACHQQQSSPRMSALCPGPEGLPHFPPHCHLLPRTLSLPHPSVSSVFPSPTQLPTLRRLLQMRYQGPPGLEWTGN